MISPVIAQYQLSIQRLRIVFRNHFRDLHRILHRRACDKRVSLHLRLLFNIASTNNITSCILLTLSLWTLRVHFFMTCAAAPLLFWFPETHGPTILTKRAKKLRKQGENAYSAWELENKKREKTIVFTSIKRPFGMFVFGCSMQEDETDEPSRDAYH